MSGAIKISPGENEEICDCILQRDGTNNKASLSLMASAGTNRQQSKVLRHHDITVSTSDSLYLFEPFVLSLSPPS